MIKITIIIIHMTTDDDADYDDGGDDGSGDAARVCVCEKSVRVALQGFLERVRAV